MVGVVKAWVNVLHCMSNAEPDMAKTTTLTFRIEPSIVEKLDLLARKSRRSKSAIMTAALEGYVAYEEEIVLGIERAQQQVRAGQSISHEDAIAELRSFVEATAGSQRDKVA